MIRLFHGKNSFISYREARTYIDDAKSKDPDREYLEIEAETLDISEIVQTYQTHGMFSTRKLIFIKRLYQSKERSVITEHLVSDFQDEDPSIEIIIWESQKIPANTKYLKFFRSSNSVYESPELNKRTFITWAKEECIRESIDITIKALQELAQRCNFDPERFVNEIKKVKLLSLKHVDIDDIQKISADTFEYDIWKLIDHLNEHDRQTTAVILDRLLKQNVDPHYILAMIYRNTRLIVLCRDVIDGGGDSRDVAKTLKIPPFTVPSIIRSSKQVTRNDLVNLYEKMTNLDFQIKVGAIDATIGLTLLSTIL